MFEEVGGPGRTRSREARAEGNVGAELLLTVKSDITQHPSKMHRGLPQWVPTQTGQVDQYSSSKPQYGGPLYFQQDLGSLEW